MRFSERLYLIEIDDLLALPVDPRVEAKAGGAVVVLLGRADLAVPDVLAWGRETLEAQKAEGETHALVRFAFEPVIATWHPGTYISKLRKRYKTFGSGLYHMAPADLRGMEIERGIRTEANAYAFTSRRYRVSDDVRMSRYSKLRETLRTEGWREDKPLGVMLRRSGGVTDSLDNGHHRLSLCLELGITRVTVQFCYAGCAPVSCCKLRD